MCLSYGGHPLDAYVEFTSEYHSTVEALLASGILGGEQQAFG